MEMPRGEPDDLSIPIGDVLTEPLTCIRLAEYFRVNRDTMRVILKCMVGVERAGSKWSPDTQDASRMIDRGLTWHKREWEGRVGGRRN